MTRYWISSPQLIYTLNDNKLSCVSIYTHTSPIQYFHKPNARTEAKMSPLIRIALAINSFSSSHTLRKLMKYSTLLHIFLNSIFNFFFNYLCYPLCKHKGCDHQLSVYQYVSQSQEEVDCAVCLCTMKEREEIRVLRCEHVFHKDCLDTWIRYKYNNTTCPLCRVSVGSIREVDTQVIVHDHFHELPWLRWPLTIIVGARSFQK